MLEKLCHYMWLRKVKGRMPRKRKHFANRRYVDKLHKQCVDYHIEAEKYKSIAFNLGIVLVVLFLGILGLFNIVLTLPVLHRFAETIVYHLG